jgi:DNA-binding MarR family transcriptional regulator
MEGKAGKSSTRTGAKTSNRSVRPDRSSKVSPALDFSSRSHRKNTTKGNDVSHRLIWDISAISDYTMRIAELLGKRIDVSGPQWMIMMAIEELREEGGLSVKAVAALLHVDSSFVSVQSRILENLELVRRSRSRQDRRIMLLSLTDKAIGRLKPLIPTRSRLQKSVRANLDENTLLHMSNVLSDLRDRMRKEAVLIAAGEWQ